MADDFQQPTLQNHIELVKLGNDERKSDRDLSFRGEELALKREELDLKRRELSLKEGDQKYSRWLNPVFLGIIAATLTLLGNILVTHEQAQFTREQEQAHNINAAAQAKAKAQSDLVLEAIKTGDPAKAATNLEAFVRLGYLDDPEGKIRAFLSTKDESTFPVLPSATGLSPAANAGIFRNATEFNLNSPERLLSRSVGRLDISNRDNGLSFCTAWVIAKGIIVTADFCVSQPSTALGFVVNLTESGTQIQRIDVEPMPLEINPSVGFALLRLKGDYAAQLEPLTLSFQDPTIGESILLIHNPAGRQATISESPDCKVTGFRQKKPTEFTHTCATAAGSSGAPIISSRDFHVIGLHHGKSQSQDPRQLVNYGEFITSVVKASNVLPKLISAQ